MVQDKVKSGDLTGNEQKLFETIQNGDVDSSLALLNEEDVRINCLDKYGTSLLQQACFKGMVDVCHCLLSKGADVNSNDHEHGYTALMFAALSGNAELCRILLEAGAKTHTTNRVGKTASEMAAFTGQHHCVSVINNFLSQDDIEYWIRPPGSEKPRLPLQFAPILHKLARTYNVRPAKTVLFLMENSELISKGKEIVSFLEDLVDIQLKQRDTNEVTGATLVLKKIMALKLHIIQRTLKTALKFLKTNRETEGNTSSQCDSDLLLKFARNLLFTDKNENYPKGTEILLRQAVKEFPHRHSVLFQTLVKSLSQTEMGKEPSAVNAIHQTLLGQRMMMDETFCFACGESAAKKRCSACKQSGYVSGSGDLYLPSSPPSTDTTTVFDFEENDKNLFLYEESNRSICDKLGSDCISSCLQRQAAQLARLHLGMDLSTKISADTGTRQRNAAIMAPVKVNNTDNGISKPRFYGNPKRNRRKSSSSDGQSDSGCSFCRQAEDYTCFRRGEVLDEEADSPWKHHQLKDSKGNVTCPYLYHYTCKVCRATGKKAHTERYCPVKYERTHTQLANRNKSNTLKSVW